MKPEKKCPLCSAILHAPGYPADESCPTMVVLPTTGRIISHYVYQSVLYVVSMIVLPYRIINRPGLSKISRLMNDEEMEIHRTKRTILDWKTILHAPPIHPDKEDKLLERIKRLILLS